MYRGKRSAGPIAQDVEGVFDTAIGHYTMDGTEYLALDRKALLAPVIEGMKVLDKTAQDHEQRISGNEKDVEQLKEENKQLRKQIAKLK